MRALVAVVVAVPAIASADAWNELGLVRTETAMGDNHVVDGYVLRFAPRVNVTGPFYAGAELDGGRIGGDITTPSTFRAEGATNPTTSVEGEQYAVRAVAGLRMRVGSISGAGELAGGFHRAQLRDSTGAELETIESTSTMFEGRARLDVWVTPRISIGAVAGVELDQPSALSAGIMLGLHAENYDAMP